MQERSITLADVFVSGIYCVLIRQLPLHISSKLYCSIIMVASYVDDYLDNIPSICGNMPLFLIGIVLRVCNITI
jgi:hypothetical protein